MSQKLNLVIEFSAANQPVITEVEHSLSAVSVSLGNLARQASYTGSAVASANAQISLFANSLRGQFVSVLNVAEKAISRLYSSIMGLAKISFGIFIAEIYGLSTALKKVATDFVDVNQKFASMQITLASSFRSLSAAKKIRDEIVGATAVSPIPFQGLSDLYRTYSVLPATRGAIVNQYANNNLGDANGFFTKGRQLAEMLLAYRPDKNIQDAIFSIRQALSGDFRSIIRRFSVPTAGLAVQAGEPLSQLSGQPDKTFKTLFDYFSKIITPGAISQLIRQPDVLKQNLREQAYEIPLLKIGDSGLYKKVVDFFVHVYDDVLSFTSQHLNDYAQKISDALSKAFDAVTKSTGNLAESLLGKIGLGRNDHPEMSLIQRSYEAITKGIQYVSEKLPVFAERAQKFLETLLPLLIKLGEFFLKVGNFFVNSFSANPLFAGLELVLLRSLPEIFGRVGISAASAFSTSIAKSFASGAATGALSRFSSFAGVGLTGPSLAGGASALGATAVGGSGYHWWDVLGLTGLGRNASSKATDSLGRDLTQLIENRGGEFHLRPGAEQYLRPEDIFRLGGGSNGRNTLVSNRASFLGSGGLTGRRTVRGAATTALGQGVGEEISAASGVLTARSGLGGVLASGAALVTDVVLPLAAAAGIFYAGSKLIESAATSFNSIASDKRSNLAAQFTGISGDASLAQRVTQNEADRVAIRAGLQAANDRTGGPRLGSNTRLDQLTTQIQLTAADLLGLKNAISTGGKYTLKTTGEVVNITEPGFLGGVADLLHIGSSSTANLNAANQYKSRLEDSLKVTQRQLDDLKRKTVSSIPEAFRPTLSGVLRPEADSQQRDLVRSSGTFSLQEFMAGTGLRGSSATSAGLLGALSGAANNTDSDANLAVEKGQDVFLRSLYNAVDPSKEARANLSLLGKSSTATLTNLSRQIALVEQNKSSIERAAADYATTLVPVMRQLQDFIGANPSNATGDAQAALKSLTDLHDSMASGNASDSVVKSAKQQLALAGITDFKTQSIQFAQTLTDIVDSLEKTNPEEGAQQIARALPAIAEQLKLYGYSAQQVNAYTANFSNLLNAIPKRSGLGGDAALAETNRSANAAQSVYSLAGGLSSRSGFSNILRNRSSLSTYGLLSNAFDLANGGIEPFALTNQMFEARKKADLANQAAALVQFNQNKAFGDFPAIVNGVTSVGSNFAYGKASSIAQGKLADSISAFKTLPNGGPAFPSDAISALNKNLTLNSFKPSDVSNLVEKYQSLNDIYPRLIEAAESYKATLSETANPQDIERVDKLIETLVQGETEAEKKLHDIVGPGMLASFTDGFKGITEQWRVTADNFTSVGAEAANSLSSNFNTFFSSVTAGNKSLGASFRTFITGVLSSTASAFASHAFQSFFGSLIGALGGTTAAASSFQVGSVSNFSTTYMAAGGPVRGGSGVRDDVPALLMGGEYVLPRSVVQRYGTAHFDAYRYGSMAHFASGGGVGSIPVPSMPMHHVDNSQVHITVNGDGGRSSTTSGSVQSSEQNQKNFARMLESAVLNVIDQQKRNGGRFSKTSN